jgi:hypothetical protein
MFLKTLQSKRGILQCARPKSAGFAWKAGPLLALLFFSNALVAAVVTPEGGKPSEVTKVTIDGKEFLEVGFEKLSAFDYKVVDLGTGASPAEIEEAKKRDQVPAAIKSFNHKPISLTGYMQPLQLENGLVTKFVMMKDVSTCCYGAVPRMNDYVIVSVEGKGVPYIQDIPVVLTGIFQIDERYEDGYLVSLFKMDCEKFLGQRK